MREIKVRTWDKKHKQFRYLELTNQKMVSKELVVDIDNNYRLQSIENLSDWQEYTGLKDKKGNEIYEGDILKKRYIIKRDTDSFNKIHPNNQPPDGDFIEEFLCRVEFRPPSFDFIERKNGLDYGGFIHPGEFIQELEIIGNIYETPELLEEKV